MCKNKVSIQDKALNNTFNPYIMRTWMALGGANGRD